MSNTRCALKDNHTLFDCALAYQERGFAVIPTIGKKATGRWKPFQTRVPDEITLRRLFGIAGVTGLAVILGRVSGGLACRDFDEEASYHRWVGGHPDLAAILPTVKTARGYHVYSRAAEERFIKLSDGEYRADHRHYVLLPPSRHPQGCHYFWVILLPEGPLPLVAIEAFTQDTQVTQGNPCNSTLHVSDAGLENLHNLESLMSWTLPTDYGQRNQRLFDLARGLKGIPALDTSAKNLRKIVREWFQKALPTIRTKDFDTTWTDFAIAWERAKYPVGASFETAVARAKAIATPDAGLIYESEDYRLLVTLCSILQEKWGASPFPLSCRKAGEALGIGHDKAWRILQALKADGLIIEIRKGTNDSGMASEWRYLG